MRRAWSVCSDGLDPQRPDHPRHQQHDPGARRRGRPQALESEGVISRYAAIINERAVGLPISVFVTVTLSSQAEASLTAFETAIATVPEVVECYLMTGGSDYLLRLVVRDVDDLERVHSHELTRIPGVTRVSSSVAMRTVVKRGALPV